MEYNSTAGDMGQRLTDLGNQAQHGHQHHHGGHGLLWMALGLVIGNALGQRQQGQSVEQVPRPEGWKTNVLWKFLLTAFVLHVASGFIAPDPATFWLVFGSIIWIPAWGIGLLTQHERNEHNKRL